MSVAWRDVNQLIELDFSKPKISKLEKKAQDRLEFESGSKLSLSYSMDSNFMPNPRCIGMWDGIMIKMIICPI